MFEFAPVPRLPGRGKPGGSKLLDRQIKYLRFVRETAKAHKPSVDIPEVGVETIIAAIQARYLGHRNEFYLELGIPAVWKVLAETQPGERTGRPAKC